MRSISLPVLVAILLFSICLFGQSNPNTDIGMKPYDSLHGGALDSVSLTSGNLFFHHTEYAAPQRGRAGLSLSLQYNNKGFQLQTACAPPSHTCSYTWHFVGNGMTLIPDQTLYVNSKHVDSGIQDQNGNELWVYVYSAKAADGSMHPLGDTGNGFRSIDGSGILWNGSSFTSAQDRSGVIETFSGTSADPNGNFTSTDSSSNWIDTLWRTIPAVPGPTLAAQTPPASTASLSSCPNLNLTYQPVTYAYTWNPPGPTGTSPFILCFARVYIRTALFGTVYTNGGGLHDVSGSFTLLQSLVQPDGTAWTFTYDGANPNDTTSIGYGDLLKISFPTGGSISYTYATEIMYQGQDIAGLPTTQSRSVTSRTVDANDGTGAHTWTYNWNSNIVSNTGNDYVAENTVTDPLGNDTVHQITGLYGGPSLFETQTRYYQGSQGSGTLLKTVNTDYSYSLNPFDQLGPIPGPPTGMNVEPIRVTTVWLNGLTSKVETDYDSGFSFRSPLWGQPINPPNTTTFLATLDTITARREYDYGSGGAGNLLRQTLTTYLWQSNSNYLNSNLLDLPFSVVVQDGNGNRVAEIDSTYDESLYLKNSGVTTQHGSPATSVRGNLTTVSRWLSAGSPVVTHTNWYDTGEVYQAIDALGNATTHSYDPYYAGAYSTQTCNALNQCVSGTYDFNSGLLTSFTDQNGAFQASGNSPGDPAHTSNYAYDSMFWMTQALFPPDSSGTRPETDFYYPNSTMVKRCKKQNDNSGSSACGAGWIVDYAYFDGLGRTIQTRLVDAVPGDDYVDTTYDALGRVSTLSNPHRTTSSSTDGVTTNQYDALGRVTQVTKQDNSTTSVQYDLAAGNTDCTLSTDEAGKQRKLCSDGLGSLTQVREDPAGLNYETDYQYDTLGNLLRVDQKGGTSDSSKWRTRLFTYDSLSRLLTASNPESGQIGYTYDANGNLLTKTDANGIVVTLSYDALDRLTEKSYSNGHASEIFSYDETSSWGSTLTNTVGRLTTMYHGNTGEVLSYDSMGRLMEQWSCGPHNCGSGSYQVQAQYDLTGNLTLLTYPSTRVVSFNYNAADRLNQVQFTQWNWAPLDGGAYTYWSAADNGFYPNGVPQTWMLGSGLTESTALNPRLQLQEEIVSTPGLGTFADHVYNYGTQNNGNVLSVTDKLNSAYSQSFTYDSLNRLASATETRWGMNYVYDAWGNYLQQNLTLGSGYQHQYVANGNNQLSGYSYDANGNMLYDGFHHYDYNAENQILDVDSYTDSYTYDAEGNRERKDAGGQPSTEYVYFNGQVIAEKNTSTEDWSEYIYANGKRIAKAVDFEDRILIQGTNCTGCGSQYTGFTINGISWLPYVIQTGDQVMLRQKTNSGLGGVVLYFSDGSSTRNVATDSDGQLLNSDGMTGYFHYRTADLSAYAGKTLTSIALISETTSGAGPWLLKYADFVLISTDGTVQPIYTNETTVSLTQFGSSRVTGVSGGIDHVSNSSDPTNTTWYYHGDQIGSSRLMSANEGWPVWQGTFLPYGEEYNPQITTNNYKFTGKERDSETGLDYFGARYYENGLGRWMTPDWAAKPEAVPYSDLYDPQSLNLYSYVRNIPSSNADADGHCPTCDELEEVVVEEVVSHPKVAQAVVETAEKVGEVAEKVGEVAEEGGSKILGFLGSAVGVVAGVLLNPLPLNESEQEGLNQRNARQQQSQSQEQQTAPEPQVSTSGAGATKGGGTIYRVPGSGTKSSKPYIGRHNKPNPAQTRKSKDGRDRTQAEVVDRYNASDTQEGRIKEQQQIDQNGGVQNLDNKRNEIRKDKQD